MTPTWNLIDQISENLRDPRDRVVEFSRHIEDMAPGAAGRADLLVHLAGELAELGHIKRAREAMAAAVADGGRTTSDPECELLDIELRHGTQQSAADVLARLLRERRAGRLSDRRCIRVAFVLKGADRFRDAHRWFTIPLRDTDPTDIDHLLPQAVRGRWHMRRALGLPFDAYDEALEVVERAVGP